MSAEDAANWPEYDVSDDPQTTAGWQDPDDGNLLVIERGTGTWKDDMKGLTWSVRLRNAPFWEDDFVLSTVAKCKTEAEARDEAMNYMAEHRL